MSTFIDTVPYNDKYLKVIGQEKMYEDLDNMISATNMVLANRYAATIREKADPMKKHLLLLSDIYEELTKMQKDWIYMEKIFN